MRETRLARSRELLSDYVRSQGVHPHGAEGQRLIAMLLLVSGSLGLVELHDRQGLGIDEAIDISLWATRALIAAATNTATLKATPKAITKRGRK